MVVSGQLCLMMSALMYLSVCSIVGYCYLTTHQLNSGHIFDFTLICVLLFLFALPRLQNDTPGQSTAPSLREKTVLLTKLMMYVEKRFPEDTELSVQFLETVLFVYK